MLVSLVLRPGLVVVSPVPHFHTPTRTRLPALPRLAWPPAAAPARHASAPPASYASCIIRCQSHCRGWMSVSPRLICSGPEPRWEAAGGGACGQGPGRDGAEREGPRDGVGVLVRGRDSRVLSLSLVAPSLSSHKRNKTPNSTLTFLSGTRRRNRDFADRRGRHVPRRRPRMRSRGRGLALPGRTRTHRLPRCGKRGDTRRGRTRT